MIKVLFYSDNVFYGGHEALTLDAARFLVEDKRAEVLFLYSHINSRMQKELVALNEKGLSIPFESIPYQSTSFQEIRSFFSHSMIHQVQERMERFAPDLVVVAQNRIEVSAIGLLAAERLGIPTVSYLPMAHPLRMLGGSPILTPLRERLVDYLYGVPDRFITITKSMREMILSRRSTADVEVVYNGIDPSRYQKFERSSARSQLGFSQNDFLVGMVGRVQFRHKAQDAVVRAIAAKRSELGDVKLLIVGDGPDKSKLYDILREERISSHVLLHPWSPNIAQIYSAIDMLAIPSWFEGMPMIMLEAMHYGLPIVASRVDAMKEFLPSDWLFAPGDGYGMIDAIERVRRADNAEHLRHHQEMVLEDFRIEDFGAEFAAAIGL